MKITAEAILLDDQIYPAKNISSARMIEREVDDIEPKTVYRKRLLRFSLVFIVLVAIGISLMFHEGIRSSVALVFVSLGLNPEISSVISFFMGLLIVYFVFRSIKEYTRLRLVSKTEYGIELLSNSGGLTLFWSRDRDFMEQVRDLIFRALTTSSKSLSYTVNIDNKNIEDNSTQIYDSEVNIYDYSISYAQYDGLTEEQMAFMTGQFKSALSELRGQSEKRAGDEELLKNIQDLVEAMKSENPDKSRIKRSWEQLKTACDVLDTSEKVAKLLAIIGTGVSTVMSVL